MRGPDEVTGKPLTVSVTITVTLRDPGEWTDAFGVTGRAAIRQDIKSYIGNEAQRAGVFGNGEVFADIEWK